MITQRPTKQTAADERKARALVTERDSGVCVKCGRVHPIHGVNWDHRKNRSQGGRWEASNGQLLCGSGTTGCHGWVTSHPKEALAEGWTVPGWADPRVWPARRWAADSWGIRRAVWVLYDNHGGFTVISDEDAARRMEGVA